MPSIPELPTEIVLIIQGFLPLQTLIKARGVCRLWRSLIPGSHLPAARRRLLEFYLRAIRSPAFLATRPRIQAHLKPFDRERLLARLPPSVPEEFRTWVLEWPARAAVGHIWPGLHNMAHRKDTPPALHKDRGVNLLWQSNGHILSTLRVSAPKHPGEGGWLETTMFSASGARKNPHAAYALLLDDACVEGWQRSRLLVLAGECAGADLGGRVYQIDGVHCRVDEPLAGSWVAFLQNELKREELWLREHGC